MTGQRQNSTPSLSSSDGQPESSTTQSPTKKNFNKDEDVQLCISWGAISVDDVVGNSQTGDKLWVRILEHFRERLPSNVHQRDAKQLESRFRIINRETNKWHVHLKAAQTTKKPRGYTFADAPKLAQHLYANIDLEKEIPYNLLFKHQRCYDVLRNSEKWNNAITSRQIDQASKRNKGKRKATETGNAAAEDNVQDSGNNAADIRSLVHKKVKETFQTPKLLKDARGPPLKETQSSQQTMEDIEKRKAAALEKIADNKALSNELTIMMQDCPESRVRQNQYFALMQKRIIEKMRFNEDIARQEREELDENMASASESDDGEKDNE